MATIYNIKVVSHWINYSQKQMQELLETAMKSAEENNNTITVTIEKATLGAKPTNLEIIKLF